MLPDGANNAADPRSGGEEFGRFVRPPHIEMSLGGLQAANVRCGSSRFPGAAVVTGAVAAANGDFAHIVRLENVQKYFGAVHALKNINLAVGRNEIVGLIGDNGAGKSTLIKTLTGVIPPTSGRIFVRDKQIDLAHHSVGQAHALSIETVYQDKSLGEKQPL